jgi:hypothetical protein
MLPFFTNGEDVVKREVGQGGQQGDLASSGLRSLEDQSRCSSESACYRYRDRERARSARRAESVTEVLTQSSAAHWGAPRRRFVRR